MTIKMKKMAIENLCWYDKRRKKPYPPEEQKHPCTCWNCIYERHDLAENILELIDRLENLRNMNGSIK